MPDTSYRDIVVSAAKAHGLDPILVFAVIEVESGGDPRAVSCKGARGLMQLMPEVCKSYGVTDPFDMQQNIHAGTAYLAHLLDAVDGDLICTLAAYNCGLRWVIRYQGVPPFQETRKYVRNVVKRYKAMKTGIS